MNGEHEMSEEVATERTISAGQRVALIGLVTIAARLNAEVERVVRTAAELTGEPDHGYGYFGLITDLVMEASAVAAEAQVDRLLTNMKIVVEG
jgi:hypothetical protein